MCQDFVNDALCDMINRFVFVYLDDIMIVEVNSMGAWSTSASWRTSCLEKLEKCEFLVPKSLVSLLHYRTGRVQIDGKWTALT